MAFEQQNTFRLVPLSTGGKCVILKLLSCQKHFVLRKGQMRMLLMCNRGIHLTSNGFHDARGMSQCFRLRGQQPALQRTAVSALYTLILSNLLNYCHRVHTS